MTQQGKTRLMEKAVSALLSKNSVSAAARECGISARTLQRWQRDPAFDKAFREAKVRLVRDTTTRLTANAGKAARILQKIFDDKKSTPAARVSAAVNTIRLTLDAFQLEELEERICKLELQRRNSNESI